MGSEQDRIAEESLRRVTEMFFGKARKRPRAKPHRCFDCGRVTKHVRCADCSEKRRERDNEMD